MCFTASITCANCSGYLNRETRIIQVGQSRISNPRTCPYNGETSVAMYSLLSESAACRLRLVTTILSYFSKNCQTTNYKIHFKKHTWKDSVKPTRSTEVRSVSCCK